MTNFLIKGEDNQFLNEDDQYIILKNGEDAQFFSFKKGKKNQNLCTINGMNP